MDPESTSQQLPQRVEAVESKLAYLEKSVDDLDAVVRDLFGRAEQIERVMAELGERIERLVGTLGGD